MTREVSQAMTKRVLFVCMGNICRSPAAEAVFVRQAFERGVGEAVEADSAGTIAYHSGEGPDARMRRAAAARGVEVDGQARPVVVEDFESFDLIVAMDRDNLRDLESMRRGGRARLALFSDFLPSGNPTDVPDPYYGGPEGFDNVLDLLEQGCPELLDRLVA